MGWKFVIIAPKDYGMDQHINHSNDLLGVTILLQVARNRNDNLIHSFCYQVFSNLFRLSFYSNEMMVKTNSFRVNFYIFKTRNTRNMFFSVFITYETPTKCYQGLYELTSTHASALRIMRSFTEK